MSEDNQKDRERVQRAYGLGFNGERRYKKMARESVDRNEKTKKRGRGVMEGCDSQKD